MTRLGFVTVRRVEAEITAAVLERAGWRIFRLPASIDSRDEFFTALRSTLPLNPALQSNRSWDALSDSLWGGLDSLEDERIVIIWPDASRMRAAAPGDFDIAADILADLPASLADPEVTAGPTKQLLILLVMD